MALPKQTTPVYTTIVPSTKKEIKYRPFLVREEKALLIAQQSEDPQVMLDTLKSMMKSCVQTPIDVDSLALFDIEYLFCQLRAKSVGEIIEMMVMCDVCPEEETKARVKLTFDLTKIDVNFPEGHSLKIPLFDDVGLMMKYPTLDMAKSMENVDEANAEQMFDSIIGLVDYVYDSDEVHYAKDQTKEELVSFFDNLTQDQFKQIKGFLQSMPKLSKRVSYDCPVCGHHHDKVVEGLNSFF